MNRIGLLLEQSIQYNKVISPPFDSESHRCTKNGGECLPHVSYRVES